MDASKKGHPYDSKKFYIDFEEVFDHVGHFGLFQCSLFFLTGISTFNAGLQMISSTFLAADIPHWCHVERLANFRYEKNVGVHYCVVRPITTKV